MHQNSKEQYLVCEDSGVSLILSNGDVIGPHATPKEFVRAIFKLTEEKRISADAAAELAVEAIRHDCFKAEPPASLLAAFVSEYRTHRDTVVTH